ncbi:MAG TPA: DUF885 domain-containing protein [Flavipsychrobacter sp.]|nr:DUF885 domain-containing protein [Flavipsychrobacter sp.]
MLIKKTLLFTLLSITILACGDGEKKTDEAVISFGELLDDYWEERMQLFPIEATANGDNRYNDRLTITIAQSFRDSLGRFYQKYISRLENTDSASLDAEEQVSYGLLKYEMRMGIEGLKYPTHYIPINQFWAFTLDFPQLGSGDGNQPFKTVKDYDNFLARLAAFPAWTDTAINNMRKGIEKGWVLPRPLVVKMLPQLKAMIVSDRTKSVFYGPVKKMPDSFGNNRQRLEAAYGQAIDSIIVPCYTKLHRFFEEEYLPKARENHGISAIPMGAEYYQFCIRQWTTTQLSPDSIYNIGLSEVAKLGAEMNKVRDEVGFKGTLQEFFEFMNKDRRFYPFSTEQEVLDSFWSIKKQEDPQLKKLFNNVPKSPFTIRQTEEFREASASAEYNPASEDGTRPGIFYTPIIDPKKFNAVGMETLFLHEAIPGHHYQISLQQENKDIPKFRRFLWYGAYGEGWALYSESLGKELGLYRNPYQYFGHLSDAMHRAIRLVVDVGIHHKGMSREEAIAFMRSHERISEDEATAEIERYMAIPGQALSYKIGQLTIRAERTKYEQQLGSKFNIASFHDEVLKYGCLPLQVLQGKLAQWAKK